MTNIFFTHYSSEQVLHLHRYSSGRPLVLFVVLVALETYRSLLLHCESEHDESSQVLYWSTPTSLEVQRGFQPHNKKQERHPIKSPSLTGFHYLVGCRSRLEPPHCAAHLSKSWDWVGWQGSLRPLTTNDHEEGSGWSTSSVGGMSIVTGMMIISWHVLGLKLAPASRQILRFEFRVLSPFIRAKISR